MGSGYSIPSRFQAGTRTGPYFRGIGPNFFYGMGPDESSRPSPAVSLIYATSIICFSLSLCLKCLDIA